MVTVFAVCVLEPCCEKTEPGFTPRPRPYYVRTPGWSDSCNHLRSERYKATITTYKTPEEAEAEYQCSVRGWGSTDGWLYEGESRRRVSGSGSPIKGTLTTHFWHGEPVEIPFPTIDSRRPAG